MTEVILIVALALGALLWRSTSITFTHHQKRRQIIRQTRHVLCNLFTESYDKRDKYLASGDDSDFIQWYEVTFFGIELAQFYDTNFEDMYDHLPPVDYRRLLYDHWRFNISWMSYGNLKSALLRAFKDMDYP